MPIKAIFGGASIGPKNYPTDESVSTLLTTLKNAGVTTIDTARIYPGSEETIGRNALRSEFSIDTKLAGGFVSGTLTPENVVNDAADSLSKLNIPQIDILYIHAPEPSLPLEPALKAINEVYKKGTFKRLGLSNYTAEGVQEVYDLSKKNGWILPSVYQGNYNPISRHLETSLFPTLRRLGMSFYAYSPLAGGFLTKSKADIDSGVGRFNQEVMGGLYNKLYNREGLKDALVKWNEIAEKEGVSKAELAYRWVGYNSALKEEEGDAVLFGGRNVEQVEQTAGFLLKKGKLSEEAARGIEEIWKKVEGDSPVDNYHF